MRWAYGTAPAGSTTTGNVTSWPGVAPRAARRSGRSTAPAVIARSSFGRSHPHEDASLTGRTAHGPRPRRSQSRLRRMAVLRTGFVPRAAVRAVYLVGYYRVGPGRRRL